MSPSSRRGARHGQRLDHANLNRLYLHHHKRFLQILAMTRTLKDRLEQLRAVLKRQKLDAVFIPQSDPHGNEYIPACWQRRQFITGFTGSSGDALISQTKAWLWTDSRYFTQAEIELRGSSTKLCRQGNPSDPSLENILEQELRGARIAVDPSTLTISRFRNLQAWAAHYGIQLITPGVNLVDSIWSTRPPLPSAPADVYPLQYAGESSLSKLTQVRETLRNLLGTTDYTLPLYALDQIAWLLNIRGSDIPYNPVKICYVLLQSSSLKIYLPKHNEVSVETTEHLVNLGGTLLPYTAFEGDLQAVSGVAVYTKSTPADIVLHLESAPCKTVEFQSPIPLLQARKNPQQIQGMRAAHERDGLAMVKFLSWLESSWHSGISEVQIAQKLLELRHLNPLFREPSFPTIAGFGAHGAIVHYRATAATDALVDASSLLLLDSGGQYLDGTTDVTRTIALGRPTQEQKELYTLVLKGHIALSQACFLAGTRGNELDILARGPLWQRGLHYGHGTGHGVGSFLNVHEGPQSISLGHQSPPLEVGMVLSNEPGYYLPGHYGIRIENLLLVTEKASSPEHVFLGFEDLTLVPYSRNLIELRLLSENERSFIDAYHARVMRILAPQLDLKERLWLSSACAPLK
jgi:Xaa-Pro aminopeptidase